MINTISEITETCVEDIKIAIQERKFIHVNENKGNKLSFIKLTTIMNYKT